MTRAGLRLAFRCLALGIALVLAIVAAGRELDQHIGAIESWITGLGPVGVLAFVPLFVLTTSLLVPDTVLCILAGGLFGMGWGVAAVVGGSLLASALQFALSRRLLRARIARALTTRPSLATIQRAVTRDELRLQVLLRLTPLNPATISYLLGAAGVRFKGFMVACLALAPVLTAEVYVGYAGRHMAQMAGRGERPDRVHDLVMIGGVVMCALVVILVARAARRAVVLAVDETEPEPAGAGGPST